jgi:uncharacterized membrane protein
MLCPDHGAEADRMFAFPSAAGYWVFPQHSGTETLAILLRWVHLVAAVTWLGLLYFFNVIYIPFMSRIDAELKPKLMQTLQAPALNWFRWSAAVTVFVGFWYWAQVYVAADARAAGKSPWPTIGLFLLVWALAFHIFMLVVRKTPNPWILAAIVVIVVSAAAWIFVRFTPVGGDDNRVLAIGVGGGIGFFMVSSAWGIIWRINKKIMSGMQAGTPPADAAALMRQAFLTSRTNFYLSFPLLFFMAAASHYPIFGK